MVRDHRQRHRHPHRLLRLVSLDHSPAAGYHPVTKPLHWGVFFLMAAQFFVGYTLGQLDEGDLSADRMSIVHASLARWFCTHLAFFAAFTLHIGLVMKHQFFDRDGLVRRIL